MPEPATTLAEGASPAARPHPEARGAYREFARLTTRWMDNDAYGHLNNVVYYSLFDSAVNAYLVRAGALDIGAGAVIGLVVETGCHYFASLAFPEPVEAGLRVARLGTTSVRYEVGIFAAGAERTAARGHFVHVYVDRAHAPPRGAAGGRWSRHSSRCRSSSPRGALHERTGPRADRRRSAAPHRRGRDHVAALGARVPADAGRTRDDRGDPRGRRPRAVGHQHAAVEGVRADRRAQGRADAAHPRRATTTPPSARTHQRRVRLLPDASGVSPFIDRRRKVGWDLYGLLGIAQGRQGAHACAARAATTHSSTRRSA